MQRRARILAASVAAMLLAACDGRPAAPPSPDRTIIPAIVSLATEFTWGPCATVDLRLASGEVLNVDPPGWGGPDCPVEPTSPLTVFHFGDPGDVHSGTTEGTNLENGYRWPERRGPLIFAGADGGGWVGTVRRDPNEDAWCLFFEKGDGAYLEGDRLHFVSGVVVPLGADFEWPWQPRDEAFPLRYGDELCFDAEGKAIKASVWAPY